MLFSLNSYPVEMAEHAFLSYLFAALLFGVLSGTSVINIVVKMVYLPDKRGKFLMLSTGDFFCDSTPWYLVQCKTGKEYVTAHILKERMTLPIYLPESRFSSRGQEQSSPLFSGYFFIQANLQYISRSSIHSSPGVLRLVGFDGDPQPVPRAVLEAIAEKLEACKARTSLCSDDFCRGDKIRMKEGPLQGLEMVFLEPMSTGKRVSLLLGFMGRLKKIVVESEALEKVSEGSKSQHYVGHPHTRFTRGKGRKITSSERPVS